MHAMTIENRDERNACANTIVNVMANMYPSQQSEPDFYHKLWDHLFAISDYKLDVDSPFEKPTPEVISAKPNRVPYPMHDVRLRHYGYLTERFANRACQIEDPQLRKVLVGYIANHMKKTLISLNKDYATDDRLMKEIRLLTNDQLEIDGEVKTAYYHEPSRQNNNHQNKQGRKNNNKNKGKFKRWK